MYNNSKKSHTAFAQSKKDSSSMKEKEVAGKKAENSPNLYHDDSGNKKLFKADAVDGYIDYIKEKEVSAPVAKESVSITLLEQSELDTATYPGQKASFVGKNKFYSEDDKDNKNAGRKFSQDGHTAISDSGVKGSTMDSKEGHFSVSQSKKILLI